MREVSVTSASPGMAQTAEVSAWARWAMLPSTSGVPTASAWAPARAWMSAKADCRPVAAPGCSRVLSDSSESTSEPSSSARGRTGWPEPPRISSAAASTEASSSTTVAIDSPRSSTAPASRRPARSVPKSESTSACSARRSRAAASTQTAEVASGPQSASSSAEPIWRARSSAIEARQAPLAFDRVLSRLLTAASWP